MTVDTDMLTLPDIYWTPKLHKNPDKFRFIIASKHCTTKHLSKDVSSIFSLFDKQIAAYNKKARYYSGINSYWIVQNRDPVLATVQNLLLGSLPNVFPPLISLLFTPKFLMTN